MKKIFMTAVIIASLAITSVASFAEMNTSSDMIEGATAPAIINTSNSAEGKIEHIKEVILRPDGTESSVLETWTDRVTLEQRMDNKFNFSGMDGYQYYSMYFKDRYRTMINIERDEHGNLVKGTITPYSERVANYNSSLYEKYNTFSAIKAQYTSSDWKSEGAIQTGDGRILLKVSKNSIIRYMPDKAGKRDIKGLRESNSTTYVYLDKTTGLPVKEEFFIEEDGEMKLQYTKILEYNYVDDENVFNTDGVTLEELPLVDFDPTQGVG